MPPKITIQESPPDLPSFPAVRRILSRFSDKTWFIVKYNSDQRHPSVVESLRQSTYSEIISPPPPCQWIADPFVYGRDLLLVEAFNPLTKKGEIWLYDLAKTDSWRMILRSDNTHYSFPSLHNFGNGYLLACESPDIRGPVIYLLDHNLNVLHPFTFTGDLANELIIDPALSVVDHQVQMLCTTKASGKHIEISASIDLDSLECRVIAKRHHILKGQRTMRNGSQFLRLQSTVNIVKQLYGTTYGSGIEICDLDSCSNSFFVFSSTSNITGPHTLSCSSDNSLVFLDFCYASYNPTNILRKILQALLSH